MDATLRRARIKELRDELAVLEAADAEEHTANADDLRARCAALIKQGEFFKALALYRHETGTGLREARDICLAIKSSI